MKKELCVLLVIYKNSTVIIGVKNQEEKNPEHLHCKLSFWSTLVPQADSCLMKLFQLQRFKWVWMSVVVGLHWSLGKIRMQKLGQYEYVSENTTLTFSQYESQSRYSTARLTPGPLTSDTTHLSQHWKFGLLDNNILVSRTLLFNPLNPELNPIRYLLALLGAHHFLHVSRIRVKLLTFRRLISYIYGAPILNVSRSHTTTQHSR